MILVDEPTSNLDPVITSEIMNDLLNLECSIVFVTHDIFGQYMERMSQIYYVHKGTIVEKGSLKALLDKNGIFSEFYKKALASSQP